MQSSKRYGSRVQLNHLQDGDISYFAVYKNAGKTVYKKVGRKSEGVTEKKTIEMRNRILSEQRHGIDISQKSYKHLTFDKLAEIYFVSNEAHNQSNHKYQLMYKKHIKCSFGDVVIAELNDSLVNELQSLKKAEGLADSTVNIIVKLIRRISGFGVQQGIISATPFRNTKLFKVNNSRLRYLTALEIQNLYKAVSGDVCLRLFLMLALGTGARANSVLSIQVKDINLDEKSLVLNDFKRNNSYIGYLNDDDFAVVAKYIEGMGSNSYVVSENGDLTKYQTIYKAFRDVFEVLFNKGLASKDSAYRVVIHTLRHTFASHLAIAGVSIQEIQKLMNHSDIKQTLKYAKLMPDSGRGFVQNLYKD